MAPADAVEAVPLGDLVKEIANAASDITGKVEELVGLVKEIDDATPDFDSKEAPLVGLVKEIDDATPDFDSKDAPLASFVKKLNDAPSDFAGKKEPLAGLVKELADAPSDVTAKEAPLVSLVEEIDDAPSDFVGEEEPLASLVENLDDAPSDFAGKEAPLAGLEEELADPSSDVAGKEAPLVSVVEDLAIAASDVAGKEVLVAGLVKELPDVADDEVPVAVTCLVKEVPDDVADKELPAGASDSEKTVASALRPTITKSALSPRGDDCEKPSGKDTADDRLALYFPVSGNRLALDHPVRTRPAIDLPVRNLLALDHPVRNLLELDLPTPKPFSTDALDLFGEPSRMLKLLSLMEDGGSAYGTGFTGLGWWVSKEDDDTMQLKVEMPGLGNEHVKVMADKNILVIKGEGDKNDEDGKGPARYSRRIPLPAEAFKMDQIKAEMKNGVLKLTVPKIKDEERKDLFQIKVE